MHDPPADEDDLGRAFLSLRRAIGSLGLWLPFILVVVGVALRDFKDSISGFYYGHGRDVFIATLFAIGVFFLAYTGHRKKDDEWLSDAALGNLTGLAAMGVAFVPTGGGQGDPIPLVHEVLGRSLAVGLHYASAIVFFGGLGVFSYFKFRRGDSGDARKQRRNRVYAACGLTIFAMMGLMGLNTVYHWLVPGVKFYDAWNPTFWLETVAVLAFAFSWLVKGRAMEKLQRRVRLA